MIATLAFNGLTSILFEIIKKMISGRIEDPLTIKELEQYQEFFHRPVILAVCSLIMSRTHFRVNPHSVVA